MVIAADADDIARRTAKEAERLIRDWRIRDALALGAPAENVAEVFGLTPARIYQIGRQQ